MPEYQPPHPTGDASERGYRPDTPEQKESCPDLSREVGALACGPACPYYRGGLDGRDYSMAPTQIESNSMSGTTEKETTEKDTDWGSLRIIVRTRPSGAIRIVHIDELKKERARLKRIISNEKVMGPAMDGPAVIVPAERTISYITQRQAKA